MSKRYGVIVEIDLALKISIYPVTLPAGTRSYTLKTRGLSEFKLSFKPELTSYMTYPSGTAESEDNIFSENPIVIYVQCEKDNEVLEVKYWVG